jgi:hypothetical protein
MSWSTAEAVIVVSMHALLHREKIRRDAMQAGTLNRRSGK